MSTILDAPPASAFTKDASSALPDQKRRRVDDPDAVLKIIRMKESSPPPPPTVPIVIDGEVPTLPSSSVPPTSFIGAINALTETSPPHQLLYFFGHHYLVPQNFQNNPTTFNTDERMITMILDLMVHTHNYNIFARDYVGYSRLLSNIRRAYDVIISMNRLVGKGPNEYQLGLIQGTGIFDTVLADSVFHKTIESSFQKHKTNFVKYLKSLSKEQQMKLYEVIVYVKTTFWPLQLQCNQCRFIPQTVLNRNDAFVSASNLDCYCCAIFSDIRKFSSTAGGNKTK